MHLCPAQHNGHITSWVTSFRHWCFTEVSRELSTPVSPPVMFFGDAGLDVTSSPLETGTTNPLSSPSFDFLSVKSSTTVAAVPNFGIGMFYLCISSILSSYWLWLYSAFFFCKLSSLPISSSLPIISWNFWSPSWPAFILCPVSFLYWDIYGNAASLYSSTSTVRLDYRSPNGVNVGVRVALEVLKPDLEALLWLNW